MAKGKGINSKLKRALAEKGMSGYQLAKAIGYNSAPVYTAITGGVRLSEPLAERMSAELGMTAEDFRKEFFDARGYALI